MNEKAKERPTENLSQVLDTIIQYGPKIVQNRPLLKVSMAMAENYLIKEEKRRKKEETTTPPGIISDQTAMSLALLRSVYRAVCDHKLSDATYEKASQILGRDLFVEKKLRLEKSKQFIEKYGVTQPSFFVISPSKACNLRCTGCYADSDAQQQTLEWDVVDRIITDAYDQWGLQFIVVSGGEPLAYRSQGKTMLDLVEKHPNTYFMFYTNSILITDEIADRMAKLGNVLPMISLEGWKDRTDARRGAGVFDKVMESMDRLYKAGVLYGVSLTATSQNCEEILSDDFIDFLFNEKHAAMGWVFQYMPIGRSFTLDLMPTPQQRLKMWEQSWKIIREKNIFLADFWNHGTVVDGCLSAGGHGKGGYMYIDWNGNISPCVFIPYSPVNIKEIYARDGTMNDIYSEPFFTDIRQWQKDIKVKTGSKNLLNPCPIRDHNATLRQLIRVHEAEPTDANAAAALQDGNYARGMDEYDAKFEKITDVVWEKVYEHDTKMTSEDVNDLAEAEIDRELEKSH